MGQDRRKKSGGRAAIGFAAANILRFAVFFFFGALLFYPLFQLIERAVYPMLCGWFPTLFREFDYFAEREAYDALHAKKEVAAAVLAEGLSLFFAVRTDNRRYERIITETDGLYRLPDGFRLCIRQNLPADLAALLLAPVPALALSWVLPKIALLPLTPERILRTERAIAFFLPVLRAFGGGIRGYAWMLLVAAICYPWAIFSAVGRFRAGWLSSFTE